MKIIGHFLAFLLAAALSVTVSAWILDHTIWNAKFLEHGADQTQLYTRLADAVPKNIADNSDPNAKAPVLEPALIQSQLTTLLPQFIAHIHRSGPAPTIDLTALDAATGQPISPGDTTTIDLGPADARIQALSSQLNLVGQYAPLAVIVLTLLVIGVMRERRLPTLSRATFEAACALGVSAAAFWLAPSLISQALDKPTLVALRAALSPFVITIMHAIASQFGIAALILLAVAIVLKLAHGAGHLKAKFTPKPKLPPRTTPPAPGTGRS